MERFEVKVSSSVVSEYSFLAYGDNVDEVIKNYSDRLPDPSEVSISVTPCSKNYWVVYLQESINGSWHTINGYGPFDKWSAADMWMNHPKNAKRIIDPKRYRYIVWIVKG